MQPTSQPKMQAFYDSDCDQKLIQDKTVAIIGYGSQGHAHALNLKESGVASVIVGLRSGSNTGAKAEQAGFKVCEPAEAARLADVVMLLTPDEVQGQVYRDSLEKNMKQGATLAFAHGLAIHYGLITPRKDLDVIMVAPKGPGHTVRSEYARSRGVPALIAIAQDATGKALSTALAYAAGLGAGRSAILQTTFRDECETDLFGEQAVLCGGVSELVKAGFETLVEAGYPAEMAYFECLHELKLIVDLMYEGGLENMRYSISNTAEYGDYSSGKRVIDESVKARMKVVLKEIQDGSFTRNWMLENQVGQISFKTRRRQELEHPIEEVGKRLRNMMPWLKENKLVKD